MQETIRVILLLLWMLCWVIGGYWITRATFKLNPNEEGVIGFVLGLAAEISLTNFISRIIDLQWASWISAIIILISGLLLAFHQGGINALRIKVFPKQLIFFIVVTYVFFLIGRGLSLYDDYAHLPTLSIMATGQIPPLFAINPDIPYRYHYFLLLFGAQIMRLAGFMPWTAWDIARSMTVAPAIILGGLWAYRVTRNRFAGIIGGAGVLFISGTRWLFLLIPGSILSKISSQVELIGAGAAAGSTLVTSLPNAWPVDGQGSFPFPYAFQNGIFTSGAESVLRVIGLMLVALLFTLLLTATRWRNALGIPVNIVLISSIGLLTEIEIFLMVITVILLVLAWIIRKRTFRLPKKLQWWLLVWFISGLIIAVQGGVWTGIFISTIASAFGQATPVSHQIMGLQLSAPSIVNHHLGILNLLDAKSIFIILIEIGPILLVLPFMAIWGWKAARAERWFEAILTISGILSLSMVFVHFSGSVRETSRLYFFITVCSLMAVSIIWLWASNRSGLVQELFGFLGSMVFFGGIIMLGVMLPNIKNHQSSYFILQYDVRMAESYWNKLEDGALIFDPNPNRAPTLFGRYTKAGLTWYKSTPEFESLRSDPDVFNLVQAGFSYVYVDQVYWNGLSPEQKVAFQQPCSLLVDEIVEPHNPEIWRKLFDISSCR